MNIEITVAAPAIANDGSMNTSPRYHTQESLSTLVSKCNQEKEKCPVCRGHIIVVMLIKVELIIIPL